jgi:hypothetical protein
MEDLRESLSLDSNKKPTNKPLLKEPMELNIWADKFGLKLLLKEDKDLPENRVVNKELFLMTLLLFLSEI